MKLLVIGIDGGTKRIVENMLMPFTQKLITNGVAHTLDEDLISRGWAEVLTGCHASENQGFYLMPFADHTYDFNASYSKADMVSKSAKPPIWRVLNDNGVKVGIANVPTTAPADEVNGFLIAGGGGGISPNDSKIPDGMVYPDQYKEVLAKHQYLFDVRLPGGEKNIHDFIRKITRSETDQKEAFKEICHQEQPDFGFHCFRMTTEIQYLIRGKIETLIMQQPAERSKLSKGSVEQAILDHYAQLDKSIEELFTEFKPDEFLIIGDHSTALFEHEGNLDVWLEQHGYLQRVSLLQKIKLKWNKVFAPKLKRKGLTRRPITKFNPSKTRAFGTFYDTGNFAGIFINDDSRFIGPVNHQARAGLVDEICKKFNTDAINQKYGLKAQPYEANFRDKPFNRIMPDIKITKPDTIYFSSRKWKYIEENANLNVTTEELAEIRYPHTGLKGRDPIFVASSGLQAFHNEQNANDLTKAYGMIQGYFMNGQNQ